MTDPFPDSPRDGSDVVRAFIPASPFSAALGVELEHIEDGRAVVRMPYDESRTTYADIVHGGAIAGLIDVTVMATAWAGAPLPESMRGVTVSLSTQYVDAARAEDLRAEGSVIRRGRSLTNVEIDVRGEDGRVVAKSVGVYKVG